MMFAIHLASLFAMCLLAGGSFVLFVVSYYNFGIIISYLSVISCCIFFVLIMNEFKRYKDRAMLFPSLYTAIKYSDYESFIDVVKDARSSFYGRLAVFFIFSSLKKKEEYRTMKKKIRLSLLDKK